MFIARAFGFATVAVNIRGTGCSGGAFDVFNPAQQADAYDVVEVVAAQDWVKGNRVGVVGLSYSGIMAMYTGAMNPPSLAAIAPQSVIPDPWGQQWPGGVYNAGFTKQWLDERDRQSAVGGTNWVNDRVSAGIDPICEENLALRSQNIDFEAFGRLLEYRPVDEDERELRLLAENVQVPVFISGAFQDEQTGPLWTDLITRFTNSPMVRVSMWNGRHPDGYTPMNIMEWYDFLQLYVNQEVPNLPEIVRVGAGPEFASNFDLEDVAFRTNELFEEFGDDYEAALAFYEGQDPIRVVLESGFGQNELGEPGGTVEMRFPTWPLVDTEVVEQFLTGDGTLADDAGAEGSELEYEHDPEAGQLDFFADGYPLFDRLWDFDWTEFPDGRQLSFLTEPMEDEVLLAGPSALRVWIGSEADDVDVQVTLSEVRPDGVEYWLQNGYLRIGHRAVDEDASSGLHVVHPLTAEAYATIPDGELVEATIVLPPVVAPIREGSRLRVQVATPGRNHGTWLFEDLYEDGEVPVHRVGIGGDTPSSFSYTAFRGDTLAALLRAAGLADGRFPEALPPCPSLRGQACRSDAP
jgi:predicted acyl esterase